MSRLVDLSLAAFAQELLRHGRTRAYLVFDPHSRAFQISQPELRELADRILGDRVNFRDHEAVFLGAGPESKALFGVFLHRTVRGQAQGGVRHWHYASVEDFLRDGLRLALGMSRKSALAGLWWGGGKAVIAPSKARSEGELQDAGWRRTVYREFGSFVSSLRGCYVAAEDVGTHPADMAEIFHSTRFATCVPPQFGGSGNPSAMTAAGVVCAMEAALDFLGMGGLEGKKVAMQGTGNVGLAMIEQLLARGVRQIVASEVSAERQAAALDRFADRGVEVRLTEPDDPSPLAEPGDILAPNAVGGVLGPKTIPLIQAPIVCGAANNQLVDDRRDDVSLKERAITLVPDFVGNRMGIVHCANEQNGYVNRDPEIERHLDRSWHASIYRVTQQVLGLARRSGVTPTSAANRLADELVEQPHPIWGHRSRQIVASLLADHWENG